MFEDALARWSLSRDGVPMHTHGSDLLPVRLRDGTPALLKIARHADERAGTQLLRWWAGDGAASVLACSGDAVVLERATGPGDLLRQAITDADADDDASRRICAVIARLHAARPSPPPPLEPLASWFEALRIQADRRPDVLRDCARTADALLASPQETVPLHGDAHHGNVLDFGARGWLAIDPKDRIGDRGFDYAQILCNPDLPHGAEPQRFARQLAIVAEAARLDMARLARWAAAQAGLAAMWSLEDDGAGDARRSLAVAATALHWLRANGCD